MPKFKKGDVVKYGSTEKICSQFLDENGAGPFIVLDQTSFGNYLLSRMDGSKMFIPGSSLEWTHSVSLLKIDVFLSAARKAVNGHAEKSPLHRKSKAS